MVGNHYAHVGEPGNAMNRTGVAVDLPLFDNFNLNLTVEEFELLKWHSSAGNFNQPELDWGTLARVRDQLVEKGIINYDKQHYMVTDVGLIPLGDLPLPAFAREQDQHIRQQYAHLKAAVSGDGGGESDQLAVDDLTLYQAQWQHVLSMTLFFLEIRYKGGRLYRVGATVRSVDEVVVRLTRDLRPLLGQTPQVNVLFALAHQGMLEHYVTHRCSRQEKFAVVAGCLQFEFPDGIISELESLGDRSLDALEAEILAGQWFTHGAPNAITVTVDGSSQRGAHKRIVEAKEYNIICKLCGKPVTLWRYPGRPPTLCSDECEQRYKRARDREKTRERTRRYRARQKKRKDGN